MIANKNKKSKNVENNAMIYLNVALNSNLGLNLSIFHFFPFSEIKYTLVCYYFSIWNIHELEVLKIVH